MRKRAWDVILLLALAEEVISEPCDSGSSDSGDERNREVSNLTHTSDTQWNKSPHREGCLVSFHAVGDALMPSGCLCSPKKERERKRDKKYI